MSNFQLTISKGSVVDFYYGQNPKYSGIVNAANERCIGGGGLDGAISKAGGPILKSDRLALPILNERDNIRCPKGQAKITGPNRYGNLRTPYVIHAVGADYRYSKNQADADSKLRSAYLESLRRAQEQKLEAVAFPLLSSGAFRGHRRLVDVIEIGLQSIVDFRPASYPELKHVYIFAFQDDEFNALLKVSSKMGFVSRSVRYTLPPSLERESYSSSSSSRQTPNTTTRTITRTSRPAPSTPFEPTSIIAPVASIPSAPIGPGSKLSQTDIAELKAIENCFHSLIRDRNSHREIKDFVYPNLIELALSPNGGQYYAVPGMQGGFDADLYYDSNCSEWRLTSSSWTRVVEGSGQKHVITKRDGTILVDSGFV